MAKFSKRENSSYFTKEEKEEILNDEIEICDCGHGDFQHRTDYNVNSKGECVECECPFFSLQHKSTMRQYLDVRNKSLI
uniref:ORF61 n=1 Tax=Nitrosopumilaceae spindle-shaped virus TaxID=3065433 RepID=A0AAT9J7N6_9VIRU